MLQGAHFDLVDTQRRARVDEFAVLASRVVVVLETLLQHGQHGRRVVRLLLTFVRHCRPCGRAVPQLDVSLAAILTIFLIKCSIDVHTMEYLIGALGHDPFGEVLLRFQAKCEAWQM